MFCFHSHLVCISLSCYNTAKTRQVRRTVDKYQLNTIKIEEDVPLLEKRAVLSSDGNTGQQPIRHVKED